MTNSIFYHAPPPRRAISRATAYAITLCAGVLIGAAATWIGHLFN